MAITIQNYHGPSVNGSWPGLYIQLYLDLWLLSRLAPDYLYW